MSAAGTDLPRPLKTLVEVAELLRARRITSEELTRATLAHIQTHEPRLRESPPLPLPSLPIL